MKPMETAVFSSGSGVASAAPTVAAAVVGFAWPPLFGVSSPPQATSQPPAVASPASPRTRRRAYLLAIMPLRPAKPWTNT